jgi:hypothetical protein
MGGDSGDWYSVLKRKDRARLRLLEVIPVLCRAPASCPYCIHIASSPASGCEPMKKIRVGRHQTIEHSF